MPPVIPSQNPQRRLHWTQSRNRHHALQSPTEDHPHQAHNPSTATRTAQDTDTSDVTRGTGPELAQGVIHPSSSNDAGDDVAMEGESVDENSAGHSNPLGSDSRRRITTKREAREARDEPSIATEQHVPRRILRKTTPQDHLVAVTTQEASDGSREKTMSVANIENNSLNLGIDFISGSA